MNQFVRKMRRNLPLNKRMISGIILLLISIVVFNSSMEKLKILPSLSSIEGIFGIRKDTQESIYLKNIIIDLHEDDIIKEIDNDFYVVENETLFGYSDESRGQASDEATVFFMIVKDDSEVEDANITISSVNHYYNHHSRYPWVIFTPNPLNETSKKFLAGRTEGHIFFTTIPRSLWAVPNNVDSNLIISSLRMEFRRVLNHPGASTQENSLYSRKRARFLSGGFIKHPIMDQFDYFIRLDPGVEVICRAWFDPIHHLLDRKRIYAFLVTFIEFFSSLDSFYEHSKKFIEKNPSYLSPSNSIIFLDSSYKPEAKDAVSAFLKSGNDHCVIFTGIEVLAYSFVRSKEYLAFFDYMDSTGGFFYENWSDSFFRTMAVTLFLHPDQIYHYSELGFQKGEMGRYPVDKEGYPFDTCDRPRALTFKTFDINKISCLRIWESFADHGHGSAIRTEIDKEPNK